LEYRFLGETGLKVSRLCFGALTIGPLQRNLSVRDGARIIRHALELGINFIDTAQLYDTYEYIRIALQGWDKPVVIATKSYNPEREGMAEALEEARRALDRDVVEVFLLHEQESELTLKGHRPALDYLLEAKARGIVKAVGISTHTIRAVRAAARLPEIDVISPLINMRGIGILDGTRDEMLAAIDEAYRAGKGLYAMKPLGGGHMYKQAEAALEWVLRQPSLASVAIGMQTEEEVDFNVACASGTLDDEIRQKTQGRPKRLHIDSWCVACGTCVKVCGSGALKIEDGKLHYDVNRCVLCGYCGAHCPEFALKII